MNILSALKLSRAPAAAFMVIGMFWGCFAAFVPVIKTQIGASDALFGTLLLASSVGLLSAMWLAPYADKILGARGMQVGTVIFALAWVFPGQMTQPALFAAAMLAVGMASGILDVVMNARVSELEATHQRSLMNANHAMFSVAYAFAAIITGIARDTGVAIIGVVAGFGALSLCLVPLMRMDIADTEAHDRKTSGYPMGVVLMCGTIVLIAFMGEATVEAWSAIHIERTLNGSAVEGALGPAMLGLTMALGRFSGQVVSDKLPEMTVVIWASILTAIGAVVAAVAPAPVMAYLGFGIMGLGVSVIGPMGLSLVGKRVPPGLRTDAISKAAVMGFSGFFLAPLAMGLLSEAFGLRIAYASVALLMLAAVPMALALRR
jgi:MFS family permease